MAIASGIKKITTFKKQSALGTAASGSGGKEFRRTTAEFNANRDMYESNEIVSHHMSTGSAYGLQKAEGTGNIELSPGTYADLMAGLLERDFASVSAISSLSLTIAASGSDYTITRAAGDFLTGGIKAGMVIRLTGGSLDAANVSKNLWVRSLTATVLTVRVLNGTSMTAEGPIASCTVTPIGKTTYTPTTGHTTDYFTVEEWYSDLSKSELFTDMKVGNMSLNMPASGMVTGSFGFVGLGRSVSGSQVLTSPTTTTTGTVAAINGFVQINGTVQAALVGFTLTVDKAAENAGAVVGSNVGADVNTGRIRVSGTVTAQFDSTTLRDLVIAETVVPIDIITTCAETATSDFIGFTLPAVKLTTDGADDGEKSIIRTYNLIGEYYSTGGSSLARNATILQVWDSAA
jgi:hypothetical protein